MHVDSSRDRRSGLRVGAFVALAALIGLVVLWEPSPSASPTEAKPGVDPDDLGNRGARHETPSTRTPDEPGVEDETAPGVPFQEEGHFEITLTGFVFDEQQRPVGAGIEVFREEPSDAATETQADGSWRLMLQLRKSELEQALLVRARDPQTGSESALGGVAIDRSGRASAVFLRLRPSLIVRGRVVDAAGAPVAGATVRLLADADPAQGTPSWATNEGMDRTVEHRSGSDGRCEIPVARSGRIRVAARGGEGQALGPSRWWTLPSDGDLDVGDVALAGEAATTWRLRFVDPEGTPATSVRVRFGQDGGFLLPEPDSPHTLPELLTDGDGRVEVSLATATEPLWAAVGSSEYESRFLRLDRTVAGIRDAELTLAPRATLRVKLVHPALSTLLEAGVEVVTDLAARTEAAPIDGLDAATGGRAVVPEGLPTWRLLEYDIASTEHSPDAEGLFRLRVPRGAELALTVRVGRHNLTSVRTAVPRDRASSDLDVDLGEGRPVVVDWDGWTRSARTPTRPETWLAALAAWPADRDLVEESEGGLELLPRELSMVRASDPKSLLWLEPGVDTIAFGFVERGARLHGGHVVVHALGQKQVAADAHRVKPPSPEAPDAAARLVRVRVQFGEARPTGGIPVVVMRDSSSEDPRGAPRGHRDVPTNADGMALVRLLPGRYRVTVSPEYQLDPDSQAHAPLRIDVSAADSPLEVTLPPLR